MSPLPTEFIDRWEHRDEPGPGEGLIYWHMLLGDNPDVVALVTEAQQRLAPFDGLHMTPLKWLHMTALIAGSSTDLTDDQVRQMAAFASRRLATIAPIPVTFGKILYHPEAIMLAAEPSEALLPVLDAAREATLTATGTVGRPGNKIPWTPHITVCYSQASQPTRQIIETLGTHLPARVAEIRTVSLVNQHGPERQWEWRPVAEIQVGANSVAYEIE